MEGAAKKGTVTPLASLFPAEDAQKAARRVQETITENQADLDRVRGFISDNSSIINLVQRLPEELHHDIMVPFGKAAFFPGRLIHTNEFLVLLGEGYFAERASKQTVEILKRRGKGLESQAESLKAVIHDLQAEASFFGATASEAAEGLVEIREDYVEEDSIQRESRSVPREGDEAKIRIEDEEYARMMSRLDELEREELEAECDDGSSEGNAEAAVNNEELAHMMSRLDELEREELEAGHGNEGDEDNAKVLAKEEGYARMISRLNEPEKEKPEVEHKNEIDKDMKSKAYVDQLWSQKSLGNNVGYSESRKLSGQKRDKKSTTDESLNKDDPLQGLTDQLNCTGLTVQSVPKDKISRDTILAHGALKSSPPEKAFMLPEVKENAQAATSSRSEVPVRASRPEFDSRKAFTGSIVERTHDIQTDASQQTSSQSSNSQPSKPVSRFKMQRR